MTTAIRPQHLQRPAYVSCASRRQDRYTRIVKVPNASMPSRAAVELGWHRSQVSDQDLGQERHHTEGRTDFHRLMAAVARRGGAVLALEAPRLSRSQADCIAHGYLCLDRYPDRGAGWDL